MKPTLSNIERRLEALETRHEPQDMEPLIIVLDDGTDAPETIVLSHPGGKPTRESFRARQQRKP